jgi:hypothetical protein
MSCRECTAVDLGQLVIAGDLNAAGLEVGHRICSKPFTKRAIGLLSSRAANSSTFPADIPAY